MAPYRLFAATAMLLAVTTAERAEDWAEVNMHVQGQASMARIRAGTGNPEALAGDYCDKQNPCHGGEYAKPDCQKFGKESLTSLCAYKNDSYVLKTEGVLCALNLGPWWDLFNREIGKIIPQTLAESLDTKQTMWTMSWYWMTLYEEKKSLKGKKTIMCKNTEELGRGRTYYSGHFNTFLLEMRGLKDEAKGKIKKALDDADKNSCQTNWKVNTFSGGIKICCMKDGTRERGKWEPLCCKWQNQDIAPSEAANIGEVTRNTVEDYLMSHVLVHAIYKDRWLMCGQED